MVRASALYIVIVIALVIAVICSSLIVSAYYYKLQYQKKFRYDQLSNNLNSGINLLLTADSLTYKVTKRLSLFGGDNDSVMLKNTCWGIYEAATCRAFIQTDSLDKAFLAANKIDSAKWAALYLIDEDRPLSVSGKTTIRGNAFVPKAGVKEAYVDGKAYQGDKQLVIGTRHDSQRALPELQTGKLNQILCLRKYSATDSSFYGNDSIKRSFFDAPMVVNFRKQIERLSNIKLSGNIIILSDTLLIIEKTAQLNNVIIFAKSISVEPEFEGRCQLFASDSIGVKQNCTLTYPSALGVLHIQPNPQLQPRISLGENTVIAGAVFIYEKEKGKLQPIADLGKKARIYGQLYVPGLVRFRDGGGIEGSVFTNRFLYQSAYTTFENYLINVTIDSKALSSHYLSSPLFPVSGKKQKILQWL